MPEGTRTKKAAGSSRGDMMDASRGVGGMYVKVVPPPDVNKNTSWFQYPGVWTTYILIIFISWLLILSVFGCDAGTAWTVVNLAHFAVSPTTVLTSCACMYVFFFLPKLITQEKFGEKLRVKFLRLYLLVGSISLQFHGCVLFHY